MSSIQVSLALAIGMIIVAIISSMGFLLYNATDRVVEQNQAEGTEKIIRQVNYDIEYYLKTVGNTMEVIRHAGETKAFFNEKNQETLEATRSFLENLLTNREDMITIALIRADGKVITNEGQDRLKKDLDFTRELYYQEALKTDSMVVSSSHIQNVLLGQYQWVVSCSLVYKDTKGQPLGVMLVDLNFSLIEDMVSRIAIGEKGYVFILDELGQLVYHPKRELIYSGLRTEPVEEIMLANETVYRAMVDGALADYIITDSAFSRWKVIGKVYVEDVNIYRTTLKDYFATMIFVALAIAIALSILLAGTILRPVKRLLRGMERFQNGHLDVTLDVEVENELGLLTLSFNAMTKRIKALIQENKKTERAKRKTELDALQAQINPHFLYNTLDSIVWMGEAGDTEAVVKMTSSLAKLFRISISKGKEYITLGQELEHVEAYLVIQQMRYGEKLSYTIEADPSLRQVPIIKILLQPLVENAIYHGIKKLPGNGIIQIRVQEDKEEAGDKHYLHIEIEDNGMGMDQETVAKLLSGEITSDSKGSGVGVMNVDQRIKLYYGEEYGLRIHSELFEGTTIQIRLPLNRGGAYEEV